jgi:hypothetical protein
MKRLWRLLLTVLFAAATWLTWDMLGRPLQGIDDAEIFFVYARNFVHGHGIVYSVGQGHVEGSSSFLYFLICAAAFAMSHRPEITLFVLNLIFVLLTSFCVLSVLDTIVDRLSLGEATRTLLAVGYLAWMLFNPLYFVWSVVTLMDTAIFGLAIMAAFTLLAHLLLAERTATLHDSLAISACIVLTLLARPEGQLWALVECVAFLAIALRRDHSWQVQRTLFAWPVLTTIFVSAGLTLFRLAYFGYPLPNTYYAKVTANHLSTLGDGRRYIYKFTSFYGWLIPMLIVAVVFAVLLLWKRQRTFTLRTSLLGLIGLFATTAMATPVIEGGDHFSGFRMYQSAMPLFFFVLLLGILAGPFARSLRTRVLYAVILVALFGLSSRNSWARFQRSNLPGTTDADLIAHHADARAAIRLGFEEASDTRIDGERLRKLFAPHLPTVGVAAAGGFAFGYDGPTYDMLGLNNVRMAHADPIKQGPKDHSSFDKGVFYEIAPEILNPWTDAQEAPLAPEQHLAYYLDPHSWDHVIYKGIFSDTRFQQQYDFAVVRGPNGTPCEGFFRRDLLAQLANTPGFSVVWSQFPVTTPAASH